MPIKEQNELFDKAEKLANELNGLLREKIFEFNILNKDEVEKDVLFGIVNYGLIRAISALTLELAEKSVKNHLIPSYLKTCVDEYKKFLDENVSKILKKENA
jgi:hypothetical protein